MRASTSAIVCVRVCTYCVFLFLHQRSIEIEWSNGYCVYLKKIKHDIKSWKRSSLKCFLPPVVCSHCVRVYVFSALCCKEEAKAHAHTNTLTRCTYTNACHHWATTTLIHTKKYNMKSITRTHASMQTHIAVSQRLRSFRFACVSVWVYWIVYICIIAANRKTRTANQHFGPLSKAIFFIHIFSIYIILCKPVKIFV